jgi:hypothetical protein
VEEVENLVEGRDRDLLTVALVELVETEHQRCQADGRAEPDERRVHALRELAGDGEREHGGGREREEVGGDEEADELALPRRAHDSLGAVHPLRNGSLCSDHRQDDLVLHGET